MKESIEKQIADFIAEAKALGDTGVKPRSAIQNGSSLHMIIKTPEQAKAFMRNLEAARTNS